MRSLSVLIACSLLTLAASGTQQATSTPSLSFSDGLLTLRASNAPLAEIFESLIAHGAVEVTGKDRLTGLASIDVQQQRLETVITTLLADYNFVITTPKPSGQRSAVRHVRIHSRRDGASSAGGPIAIAELAALRTADLQPELPDPPDPDDDPDARAEAEAEREERAAEEEQRLVELSERERSGAFDRSTAVDTLGDMLDEDNPLVRRRALIELNARTSPEALTHLLRGLADEEAAVRYQAVDLLSLRSDAASLEQLGAVLAGGEDLAARYAAFMALAARADPSSAAFVESVAHDSDSLLRAAAATFLREMARRANVPAPAATPRRPPMHKK